MIEITLPYIKSDCPIESSVECLTCGGETEWVTMSSSFRVKGVDIRVDGINAVKCKKCEDIYYNWGEAKRIEDAVGDVLKTQVDAWQHCMDIASRYGISEYQAKCWFENYFDDKRCDGCPSLDICVMLSGKDLEGWE